MKKAHTIRFILSIIIAGFIGYYIGITQIDFAWKNYQPHVAFNSKEPPPSLMNADFSEFWRVMERIESTYYDKSAIDSQKMLNGAISGMVNSLEDPYTLYLPPQQNSDFKENLAGKFEGIGAELGMKEKQIVIVAPLDGSPAKRAGLKPGDMIIKVNDEYTAGWSLEDAVKNIRGEKGTPVTLSVAQELGDEPREVEIIRDTITVKSLTSWTKQIKDIEEIEQTDLLKQNANNKIVYIRLSQFGDSTNDEWQELATELAQNLGKDSSIKGIVFDLRNNPGGYLSDAVYISSEFVKDGVAVMQEDREGERTGYEVSGSGLLTDVPLIVLINKGSASASEIVAGALRDHDRAKLVGEKSFGKGTIQQAEDLGAGAGIHVTIAKWLTPDGTWVHKEGLTPDVVIEYDEEDPARDVQLEKALETLLSPQE